MLCFGAGAAFGVMMLMRTNEVAVEVRIGPDGLHWKSLSEPRHVARDSLQALFREDMRANGMLQRSARIVTSGGQEVVVTHLLDDYDQLLSAVEAHLTPRIVTSALEQVQRGQDAKFGEPPVSARAARRRAELPRAARPDRALRRPRAAPVEVPQRQQPHRERPLAEHAHLAERTAGARVGLVEQEVP